MKAEESSQQPEILAIEHLRDALRRRIAEYDARALDQTGGVVPAPTAEGGERTAERGAMFLVVGDQAAAAARLAIDAARQRREVLVLTPQHAHRGCVDHLLSAVSGLPFCRLQRGPLSDSDWLRLSAAVDEAQALPITLTVGIDIYPEGISAMNRQTHTDQTIPTASKGDDLSLRGLSLAARRMANAASAAPDPVAYLKEQALAKPAVFVELLTAVIDEIEIGREAERLAACLPASDT